jgi:hypothetical protein
MAALGTGSCLCGGERLFFSLCRSRWANREAQGLPFA